MTKALIQGLLLVPHLISVVGSVQTFPVVQTMVNSLTQADLEPMIRDWTGMQSCFINGSAYTFQGRSAYIPDQSYHSTQYTFEKLVSYGYSPSVSSTTNFVRFEAYPGQGGVVPPGRNVIAQITGSVAPSEIVVIACHVDSPHQGADDDSTGCSALFNLARMFKGHNFKRIIRFAFFDAEENGPWNHNLFGSGYYVSQKKLLNENIVAMIAADALAWNAPGNNGVFEVLMVTRTAKKDKDSKDYAIALLWMDCITSYGLKSSAIGDGKLKPTVQRSGDNLSDHGAFWKFGNYPAVMLIEDDVPEYNPNWHEVTDVIGQPGWSWPMFIGVAKSLVAVSAHLADFIS